MHFKRAILGVATSVALASAAKHQLFVGSFSTKFLYTLEYDDSLQTLGLAETIPVNSASSWIALSYDKKNLYATDWEAVVPSFVSYSVDDARTITYERRISGDMSCSDSKSIFITANPNTPYTVYGNFFYGNAKCGSVMSVSANGSLSSVIQGFNYADGSAVHGTAISPNSQYLYSADHGTNSIWVHRMDDIDGTLKYLSQSVMPTENAKPRHVVAHPEGKYIYAVMEGTSEVVQFSTSHLNNLTALQDKFSLIKEGEDPSDFWADEIALSANNLYLWASNRAHDSGRKGYISAFQVGEDGHITQQYFLTETTSSGGFANAVAPSLFDDRVVAITDNTTGFVEVWKMNGENTQAVPVAHLDIKDGGGCCANAVWYS
ncbi:Lactonase, 7-bladed beta-propeller-domain-containing protein [Durotheca rogersii]|uniref:Lactonase, 7-bladed beta-propeller-domain-containing protein n=1 Tax=Durotheca rogersii TaxID=419775 RepID=UPI00221F2EC4|nr:Lactonase, 7-bladed beta-propeller-domain-containing protein [Durotheca rogersii]KAI5853652.1 Lactonase, 7-bladed beta-propeller-domain-containing protein [Durotheca rogersii]